MLLRKTFRSSTFRFALLAIALFGTFVICFLGYVYHSASTFARNEIDRSIELDGRNLLNEVAQGGSDHLDSAIRERLSSSRSGALYLHADPSYQRVSGNLDQWPANQLAPALQQSGWSTPKDIQVGATNRTFRAQVTALPDGSHLLVGHATDSLHDFTREMSAAVALTLAFLCLLAGIASYRITRRTVARIEAINATSRAIMDRGLSTRIPLRGSNDEWDHLALNLNSMLDRIEALLAEVKQVSENIAHDLRTPLTRMRGRLEAAYSKAPADHITGDVLAEALSDLDNVLRMFSSVMRISRIEAAERYSGFDRVDIASTVREVAELFEPAVQEAGGSIRVNAADDIYMFGDRDLLFDALSNLVDNAIKYGGHALELTITVESTPDSVALIVEDNGPGIPHKDLPYVLQRFYRVETWRGTPGHGLGLSLVAAVSRMHAGRVCLLNGNPGLVVRMEFPRRLATG